LTEHSHERPASAAVSRPLLLAFAITASFTVIEFIGGLLSQSLALMSDAGHMLTDSLALLLSLWAVRVALRPATTEKTYGYMRTEILAALINGAALIAIFIIILLEAIDRMLNPPTVDSSLMLLVAVAGLGANAAGIIVLHDRSKASLNVRGAFLHMAGDFLSSVGVIVGALLIMFFDLEIADPILSIMIGLIIAYGAWRLVTQSTSILLESVPPHLTLPDVKAKMLTIKGIDDVHDLHIWTLTSGVHSLSAHLVVKDCLVSKCSDLIKRCETLLKEEFSISHTTLQIECEECSEEKCVFK